MTSVGQYQLAGDFETYQKGLTAFRNARDWAKQMRDEFIMAANERSSNLPDRVTPVLSVTGGEEGAALEKPETSNPAQSRAASLTATTSITPQEENRGSRRSASKSDDSGSAKRVRSGWWVQD